MEPPPSHSQPGPPAFRHDFVWGAASSAYQIEGAFDADGKGPSIWDTFCRVPGAIRLGDTGDVTCDHYHRFREDIGLMKAIGLKAYRFSISWTRVLPNGASVPNSAGMDFYDALVDELLAAGIDPWVTLFHWDYPQALQDRGGWLNRSSADWFADYVRQIVDRLSDRVTHWMPINEMQVRARMGHQDGVHAPGLRLPMDQLLRVIHHLLLAHGKAVQTIRACGRQPATVGLAQVGVGFYPETESAADIEAARRATLSVTERNPWNNTWWADAALLGRYPEDGLALFGPDAPEAGEDDMRTIRQPLDFFGLNIYEGRRVRAGSDGEPVLVPHPPGYRHTHCEWNVTPEVLHWCPRFLFERYGVPIVITENGMSGTDWVALDGRVHDPQRIDYLHRYLVALREAASRGVEVRGYFAWSLLDNLEWADGFKHRFGLVHVDYATGQRTPKDSSGWYREVIRSNGRDL